MHTQVCVVGTVATDPKLTKSAGRAAFCSFRLACNERRYDTEKQDWVDSDTNWFTINSFRGLADHAVASFAKGDRVMVAGRLRVRDWSNGEKSGTSTVVEAEALGHDLRWGTSVFTKLAVAQSAEDDGPRPPEGIDAPGAEDVPRWPAPTPAATGFGATIGAGVATGATAAGIAAGGDSTQGESADSESADGESTQGDSGYEADGFTPKPEYSVA